MHRQTSVIGVLLSEEAVSTERRLVHMSGPFPNFEKNNSTHIYGARVPVGDAVLGINNGDGGRW
jgi:hypothetical protein